MIREWSSTRAIGDYLIQDMRGWWERVWGRNWAIAALSKSCDAERQLRQMLWGEWQQKEEDNVWIVWAAAGLGESCERGTFLRLFCLLAGSSATGPPDNLNVKRSGFLVVKK